MLLEQRLPERSILDVFISAAARWPERSALVQLMTGAPDEQPCRVGHAELLGLVRRAANLFAAQGGNSRSGVAYMLPSLVETHATLWGAEAAGYAVPINFLLQPDAIAGLVEASGARLLVALGPHPVLDIWQKALAVRDRVPGLQLLRVAAPGTPLEDGVLTSTPRCGPSPTTTWSSARPAATTTWRRTSTPAAPLARPGWWRTRTAANSWRPWAPRCWATCGPPTCSRPRCRCSTWAAPSSAV